MTTDDI